VGLKGGFWARFKRPESKTPVTYQVQVLVTGFNPLSPAERQRSEQLFQEARMLLWRQVFTQMQPKA
jgi:hypothetical protein